MGTTYKSARRAQRPSGASTAGFRKPAQPLGGGRRPPPASTERLRRLPPTRPPPKGCAGFNRRGLHRRAAPASELVSSQRCAASIDCDPRRYRLLAGSSGDLPPVIG